MEDAAVPAAAPTPTARSSTSCRGLHGLHVLLGLVAMIALLGRMTGPTAATPGETAGLPGRQLLLALRRHRLDRAVQRPVPALVSDFLRRLAAPAPELGATRLGDLRRRVPTRWSPRTARRAPVRRHPARPASPPRTARRLRASSPAGARCSPRTARPVTGSTPTGSALAPNLRGVGGGDGRPLGLDRLDAARGPRRPSRSASRTMFTAQQTLEIANYVESLGAGAGSPAIPFGGPLAVRTSPRASTCSP